MSNRNLARIIGSLSGQPWAIRREALDEMYSLAQRDDVILNALATKTDREIGDNMSPYDVGSVRVIPMVGPLMRYASWFDDICGSVSYERLAGYYVEALQDPKVDAIVFEDDSPGGMVTGCAELAGIIRSGRGVKPIVTYVGGDCCSAAYWLASATDHIVVNRTATVGSLGCVGIIRDHRGRDKAMGIVEHEIVSSQTPRKRPDPATKEGRGDLQAMIDATAAVFLSDVAANRGVPVDEVAEKFGQGGVFVGEDAVKAGLADEVGTLEEVLEALSEKK